MGRGKRVAKEGVRSLVKMASSNDETEIRALLKRMHTYDEAMDATYFDAWSGWVCRPSGNPASTEMLRQMMQSEDVSASSGKLLEVKVLDITEEMAYSACICSAKFSYKGTPNDDVYVMTNVFKKVGGKWQSVWGHRSTGRSPDEEPPSPWPQ